MGKNESESRQNLWHPTAAFQSPSHGRSGGTTLLRFINCAAGNHHLALEIHSLGVQPDCGGASHC